MRKTKKFKSIFKMFEFVPQRIVNGYQNKTLRIVAFKLRPNKAKELENNSTKAAPTLIEFVFI